MTNKPSDDSEQARVRESKSGLSWGAMLGIVVLAIMVAAVIAYLLVDPFFHQHPR